MLDCNDFLDPHCKNVVCNNIFKILNANFKVFKLSADTFLAVFENFGNLTHDNRLTLTMNDAKIPKWNFLKTWENKWFSDFFSDLDLFLCRFDPTVSFHQKVAPLTSNLFQSAELSKVLLLNMTKAVL